MFFKFFKMTTIKHVSFFHPYQTKNIVLPEKTINIDKTDMIGTIKVKISNAYNNIIPIWTILIFKEYKARFISNNIIPFKDIPIPKNIFFCYDDSMPVAMNQLSQEERSYIMSLNILDDEKELAKYLTCQICKDNFITTKLNCQHLLCYVCAYNIIIRDMDCLFCRGKIKRLIDVDISGKHIRTL